MNPYDAYIKLAKAKAKPAPKKPEKLVYTLEQHAKQCDDLKGLHGRAHHLKRQRLGYADTLASGWGQAKAANETLSGAATYAGLGGIAGVFLGAAGETLGVRGMGHRGAGVIGALAGATAGVMSAHHLFDTPGIYEERLEKSRHLSKDIEHQLGLEPKFKGHSIVAETTPRPSRATLGLTLPREAEYWSDVQATRPDGQQVFGASENLPWANALHLLFGKHESALHTLPVVDALHGQGYGRAAAAAATRAIHRTGTEAENVLSVNPITARMALSAGYTLNPEVHTDPKDAMIDVARDKEKSWVLERKLDPNRPAPTGHIFAVARNHPSLLNPLRHLNQALTREKSAIIHNNVSEGAGTYATHPAIAAAAEHVPLLTTAHLKPPAPGFLAKLGPAALDAIKHAYDATVLVDPIGDRGTPSPFPQDRQGRSLTELQAAIANNPILLAQLRAMRMGY